MNYGLANNQEPASPSYRYGILDPRTDPKTGPQAAATNEALLGSNTLGIEVTVPQLAQRCGLGNIDPQHSESLSDTAAIQVAETAQLPPDGSRLVTVRADLDSVGAMALFEIRRTQGLLDNLPLEVRQDIAKRIALIAQADTFSKGNWPGPRQLPSSANPWPDEIGTMESRELNPLAIAVSDFKTPIEDRVAIVRDWLLSGNVPQVFQERSIREREDVVRALENGTIKIQGTPGGKVAIVESSHRAALMLGYCLAPVVVATNPAFKQGPEEPYVKHTVAQYAAGHVDTTKLLGILRAREPGWGGSPTIIGSPQGFSSSLTSDEVASAVQAALN